MFLLLVLLVTLASSKENKTNSNIERFISTDGYYNRSTDINLISEENLNVTELFKTNLCKSYQVNCPYVDVYDVIPQHKSCCANLTQLFECSYVYKMQLLRYLNLLKSWNCTKQLQIECSSKTFNFNELSYKMYLSVCDPAKFNTTCKV